jgi:hypothetical protein
MHIKSLFSRFLLFISLCCAAQFSMWGQSMAVSRPPDCARTFMFSGTNAGGVTQGYSNYGPGVGSADGGNGCTFWMLAVSSEGFTAYTVTVQQAPSLTGTTPGTYVTYGGTVSSGTNPITCAAMCAPSSAQTFLSNGTVGVPWIRANVSGVAGTGVIYGVLLGWNFANAAGGGGGGGGGSGCVGTVTTPCVTGAENSSAAAVTDFVCDKTATIAITASGLTQIVPLSAGKSIRVCHISVSNLAASTVQVESGTGSNCAAATTAVTGVYQNVATMALDFDARATPVITSGQALCLNYGTATTAGGVVQYAQF